MRSGNSPATHRSRQLTPSYSVWTATTAVVCSVLIDFRAAYAYVLWLRFELYIQSFLICLSSFSSYFLPVCVPDQLVSMSERKWIPVAGGHDSQAGSGGSGDGSPPPSSPALPTRPDDVTPHRSASRLARAPVREVARDSPPMGLLSPTDDGRRRLQRRHSSDDDDVRRRQQRRRSIDDGDLQRRDKRRHSIDDGDGRRRMERRHPLPDDGDLRR